MADHPRGDLDPRGSFPLTAAVQQPRGVGGLRPLRVQSGEALRDRVHRPIWPGGGDWQPRCQALSWGGPGGYPPWAILGRGARGGPIGPVHEGAIGGSGGYPPDHTGDPPWDPPSPGPPRDKFGTEFCTFRGVFNKSPIRDKHGTRIFGQNCTFWDILDKHPVVHSLSIAETPPKRPPFGGTPGPPILDCICTPRGPKNGVFGGPLGGPKTTPEWTPIHTPLDLSQTPLPGGPGRGGPGRGGARGGGPPGGAPPGPPGAPRDPPGDPPGDPLFGPPFGTPL